MKKQQKKKRWENNEELRIMKDKGEKMAETNVAIKLELREGVKTRLETTLKNRDTWTTQSFTISSF